MSKHHILFGLFAGLLSALMYSLSMREQLMPWMLFTQLPLLLAGFRYGGMAALAGLLSGALLIDYTGGEQSASFFLFMLGMPAWLCTRIAWRTSITPGKGLLMLTAYYITILSIGLTVAWAQGNNVLQATAASVTPMVTMLFGGRDPAANQMLIELMSWTFFGDLGAAFLLLTILNVTIALAIEGRRAQVGPREKVAMSTLTLPRGWDAVFLALVVLAVFWQEPGLKHVAINAAIVAALPHAFMGLAFVHYWLKDYPQRRLFLLVFYALVVVASCLPLLVLLGLAEEWWRLRQKLESRTRK